MVGILTWSVDLQTTCLKDAVYLYPAQLGEKAQKNPYLSYHTPGAILWSRWLSLGSSFSTAVLSVFSGPATAPTKPCCVLMLAGAYLETPQSSGCR